MSEPPGPRPIPVVRVTVAQREAAEARLRRAAGDGLLTLEEYGDRVRVVLEATTRDELEAATADLPRRAQEPEPGPGPAPQPARRRPQNRLLLAVMGSHEEHGRWRPGPRTTAVAIMGGVEADLRAAEVDGDELDLTAISIMGSVEIIVPEGVEVEVGGFALMGSNENHARHETLHPAAPLVRVSAWSLMGGVEVRTGPSTTEGTPLRGEAGTGEIRGGAHHTDLPAPRPSRAPQRRAGRWLAGLALAAALVIGVGNGAPRWLADSDGFAVFGSDVVNVTGVTEDRTVEVFVAFGSIEVIVPEGAQVEMDGLVVFGSRDCEPCAGGPGDPVIRISGSTAFGSIEVLEAASGSS